MQPARRCDPRNPGSVYNADGGDGMNVPQDIEAAYCDMAADQAREDEALEWSEGLIADSSPADPAASR